MRANGLYRLVRSATPACRAALLTLQEQLELAGGSFKGAIGTLTYGP